MRVLRDSFGFWAGGYIPGICIKRNKIANDERTISIYFIDRLVFAVDVVLCRC